MTRRCAGGCGNAPNCSILFQKLKDYVLASKVVGTDDTPVKVLDRKLPQTRKGNLAVCRGPRSSGDYL
jgi:hypothetical protein